MTKKRHLYYRFFTETWHTDGNEIPSWRRSLHNTLENNYGVQSCPSFWWHNHATLGCALQENEARFCHQGYCPLYLAHVVHMQHPKSFSDGSCQWSVAVQKWGHTSEECTNDHGRRYKYFPHKCGTESLMTSVNAATYTSTNKTLSAFGVCRAKSQKKIIDVINTQ